MTTPTRTPVDRLDQLAASPVSPPHPDFVARLEEHLLALDGPQSEVSPAGMPARRLLAGAAAAALVVSAAAVAFLAGAGDDGRVVATRPATSVAPSTIDDAAPPAASGAERHDPAGSDATQSGGPQPASKPRPAGSTSDSGDRSVAPRSEHEPGQPGPAPLDAIAIREHNHVFVAWREYQGEMSFAEVVRRTYGREEIIHRTRDPEERGAVDPRPVDDATYRVRIYDRSGRVAAQSDWLTPEDMPDRPGSGKEQQPTTTLLPVP